jgi:peptide-methionine (S)-S-oxide reductase
MKRCSHPWLLLMMLALLVNLQVGCDTRGASTTQPQQASQESSMSHDDTDALGSFPRPVKDLDQPGVTHATAVFAGGCFWCTEAVFEQLKGVSDVTSGYAGGSAATADYQAVSTGKTGHAESIQITYDPSVISYGTLLRVFFATHDPTELNRQGNDVGTQYRSAIFYHNQAEKDVDQAYIRQLQDTPGLYKKPIVTTLEPLDKFYKAETYHQDYARQNPNQPYIRYHALPNASKVSQFFPELEKKK